MKGLPRRAATLACAVLALATARAARADSPEEPAADDPRLSDEDMRVFRQLSRPRGRYARVLLSAAGGRGFRFNNPYRLRTQLGDSAESVSLTAPYFDAGLGVAFGEPNGVQHGAALRFSVGIGGVPQQALGLGYLVLYRGDSPWMAYGRIGNVLLTQPDPNVGGEVAAGLAYFVTGSLGAHLELVGDLFYGAGTYETEYTVIPILSAQAGLSIDWEVLP